MEAVSEETGSAQRNTEPWSSLAAPVESGEELETPPGEMVLSEIEKQIISVSKDGNSAEAGGQDLLTATDVIKRGEQSHHDERSRGISRYWHQTSVAGRLGGISEQARELPAGKSRGSGRVWRGGSRQNRADVVCGRG